MIIFFDLDGPLLDVSERYQILHRDLLEAMGAAPLAPHVYWQRKRWRCPEAAILAALGVSELEPSYSRQRLELIETDSYLAHDRLWPWTRPVLTTLTARYTLVLVTVRSNREALERQLTRVDLRRFFKAVLSEPATDPVDAQKSRLIRHYLSEQDLPSRESWIIGDTEADIGAGRLLELTTVAVRCGIRDEEWLARMNPTYLIDDIRALPTLMSRKGGASRW
jgi:phosphoglycolate phosphatase-like HAD superfamily hydrolase